MVSLLLLLCAAAPSFSAWLEDAAATIAPLDDVDQAGDVAQVAAQRVGTLAAAVAPPIGQRRPATTCVEQTAPVPPPAVPRPQRVQGEGRATPRGPPQR